jgi:hypothetical protein
MTAPESYHCQITRLEPADLEAVFRCGKHSLDDFFARHSLANDRAGICRVYVLRRREHDPLKFPAILGFYTLSMASVSADSIAQVMGEKMPRYPMPVALIGRLAVDERAQGHRKDEGAERFYAKYDFETISADIWPHRMFIPSATIRAAFADE